MCEEDIELKVFTLVLIGTMHFTEGCPLSQALIITKLFLVTGIMYLSLDLLIVEALRILFILCDFL